MHPQSTKPSTQNLPNKLPKSASRSHRTKGSSHNPFPLPKRLLTGWTFTHIAWRLSRESLNHPRSTMIHTQTRHRKTHTVCIAWSQKGEPPQPRTALNTYRHKPHVDAATPPSIANNFDRNGCSRNCRARHRAASAAPVMSYASTPLRADDDGREIAAGVVEDLARSHTAAISHAGLIPIQEVAVLMAQDPDAAALFVPEEGSVVLRKRSAYFGGVVW